uniref:Tyrosine recombinase n=1 Tax=Polaromonas sp. H6N TaxID=1840293 RepID=A0A2S1FJ48_9BURK|nr:tyrosine-type recombinase/integrase [Polaromonas sp. H6N]AWD72216.1 tyrosine recombinase [Polaromonas sp. H6N]
MTAVKQLARYHDCRLALLSDEQIQAYLLHLLQERHRSRSTVNATSCAIRFLVCDVLGQTERRVKIPLGRIPQRLPELLSRAEVAALLDAPMPIKARTFLMTAYASGLRLNERCHLRGCHIDSAPDRMCIRIVQGKGAKDRYSLLTPELLDQLRLCWRACRAGAKSTDWLFASRRDPSRPLVRQSAALLLHGSQGRRHPFAAALLCPHLLASGVDLNSISHLLGHAQLSTTGRYLYRGCPSGSANHAAELTP